MTLFRRDSDYHENMPTMSRILAARALRGVFESQRRVPDHWDDGLSGSDAGIAQAILGQCLRRWGRIHEWLKPRLKDPKRGLPPGSRIPLSMGLAQLAWLPGVSSHAAVNESVEMVGDREEGFPPHRGLCNAILRKAAQDREGLRRELEALPAALDRSHFMEKVLKRALFPRGNADAIEQLWVRLQEPPKPAFRALDDGPLPLGLEPDPHCKGSLCLAEGASFPWQWLMDGHGMVQDTSSQAMMAFEWGKEPRRILDACAAPGGKTTILSRRWPKAEIVALESSSKRAERLEANLKSRRVNARVVAQDAVGYLEKEEAPFDIILIDAPCTGSGTVRKHPELTWLAKEGDLGRLCAIQRSLIQAALPRLAKGGLLLYSVCSWMPQEGAEQLKWLMNHLLETNSPEMRPQALWPSSLMVGDLFNPDPLVWNGEGFQAWGCMKTED